MMYMHKYSNIPQYNTESYINVSVDVTVAIDTTESSVRLKGSL